MVRLDRWTPTRTGGLVRGAGGGGGLVRHVVELGSGLLARVSAAPSNVAAALRPVDSDLAQQLARNPYVFDTHKLTEPGPEPNLKQALMTRLQATLLEVGRAMAFVGR